MYPGLLFIRERVIGRFLTGFAAASILQTGHVAYALFGLTSGLFYAALIHMGSMWIAPEARVAAFPIIACGYTAVEYGLMILSRRLGFATSFLLVQMLPAAVILLYRGCKPPYQAFQKEAGRPPFPARLIAASSLAVFAGCFVTYFNQNGLGVQDFGFGNPVMAWTGFLVRCAACAFFIFMGRRIRIIHLLYLSQGCTAFMFVLFLFGNAMDFPAWIASSFTNIVCNIAAYALLSAVIAKYPHRLGVFSLLALSPGIGIVLGKLSGAYAHRVLHDYGTLMYTIPPAICCAFFFVLPFVIRSIQREVDLDHGDFPASTIPSWR